MQVARESRNRWPRNLIYENGMWVTKGSRLRKDRKTKETVYFLEKEALELKEK